MFGQYWKLADLGEFKGDGWTPRKSSQATVDGWRKGHSCEGKLTVTWGLQGYCFQISAHVMSKLGNLRADCLHGGNVIDDMVESR